MTDRQPGYYPSVISRQLSRRAVLGLISVAAGAAAVTACSDSGSGSSAPVTAGGTPTGEPVRGGTVRLAFTGGGAAESLDPSLGTAPADFARNAVIFDQLFSALDGEVVPQLATGVQVEPSGSAFTLTLREGVTWHDGSPFTSADVVFTLAALADPDRPYPSELSLYFDLEAAEALDDLTVRVPTVQPVGDPAALLANTGAFVIRDGATGFTAESAVGTGPFRVTAFQAGNETRLERFDDYWGGAPVADELVLLSIDDPTARVNAVVGGQADYASDVPYTVGKTGVTAPDVEVRAAAEDQRTSYGFVLNMTRDVPADERVREAIRMGIDRQALVDTVLLGYGAPANDLYGFGAKYYDDKPVPERDADRAARLLEESGAVGKPFVVRTSDYELGLNASADLFVAQLRDLGLDARAEKVGVTEYFDLAGIEAADAVVFPLGPYSLQVTFTKSAAYRALAFPDEELQAAVATALSTISEDERAAYWQTALDIMYERGNWVVWGRGDVFSVARSTLVGIEVRESPEYPWLGRVGFTA